MNLAKYTKIRKKKKPWWLKAIQIVLVFLFGSVVVFVFLEFYKNQLFEAAFQILKTDIRLLMMLLMNIFLVCGVSLVLLYQWIDRENIRFRVLRNRYRSLLATPDYYRSIRRINIDQFVTGTVTTGPQGKLEVEYNLKDSALVTLDGVRVHKNAVQTHVTYKDGKLDGVFRTYFANGNLLAEISYKNGQLEGKSLIYYPNGFFHNEKHFKEGKLNGVFRAWDEDGSLFFEIEYQDDIQHGFDKTYRKNGIIEYEDTYINGALIRRKTFDDAGQFKYVQKYRDDS